MGAVKTAVSLPEPLFEEVEALAGQMKVSRSRLFARALREFVERERNRKLLEEINTAFADSPDREEQAVLETMRRRMRRVVRGEW